MESRVLPIPQVFQKETPFCLYACTSMVLKYFGFNKSIDEIKTEVTFRAPGDTEAIAENAGAIAAYFNDYGLESKIFVRQDWDDIHARIEKNHALIAGVKASTADPLQNHAWVVRGYGVKDDGTLQVIYNDPWDDPANNDPVAYDADDDEVPGRTHGYAAFFEHWSGGLPMKDRLLIDVCYKGQGFPDQWDYQAAASKVGGSFWYHTFEFFKAIWNVDLKKMFFEAFLGGLSFVGAIFAGVQVIGQLLTAAGTSLMNKGSKLAAGGGIFDKIAGGVLVFVGGVLTAVGVVLDFVGGVAGTAISAVCDFVDGFESVFTGANGDSDSEEIGATNIDVGLIVNSNPWKSRWGKNWEDVSGVWSVTIRDLSMVDEIFVEWEMEIGGWGIDSWTLGRALDEYSGTVQSEGEGSSTHHFKRFSVRLTATQGIRMSCSGRCKYGRDGGMTMVKLRVKATVTKGQQVVTVEQETAIYGLST